MTAVFQKLLEMSLAAGWLVLVVLVLRLALKKAPRAIVCALWALVAVRLLCPFSLQVPWSLMPPVPAVSVQQEPAGAPTDPITVPTDPVTGTVPTAPTQTPDARPEMPLTQEPTSTSADGWTVAAYVWVGGVAVMLLYAAVSTRRLSRRVCASLEAEHRVYVCDDIDTPFILGAICPRIYLPSRLSEEERALVLAHERAHLKRGDHVIKPLGFLLLSAYWFHPLLWVAYILLCRDIERACDERVIRDMNGEDRAAYSTLLLRCSVPRKAVAACPLAFGENDVRTRIRRIVQYKKPTFWIALIAVIALLGAGVFFLLDPIRKQNNTDVTEKDTVPHYYAPFAKVSEDGGTMGYAVADLDGDGQDELILGQIDTGDVTALYTRSRGQVHQLFMKDTDDRYRLYTDGYVKRTLSGGGFELFRREGEELSVAEQIMYSPQYGEQIGSSATWFRADPDLRWAYLPITEEEARSAEEEFEKAHTPLSVSYTSCSEPMTIDTDGLSDLIGRYAVGDGEAQAMEASEVMELYQWLLSVPWRQSDTAQTDEESAFVRLEFSEGETLSLGEFQLYEDDTLSYRGPQYMPLRWTGRMPEGSYRAVTARRQAAESPSYEPLSPTSDRLSRTDNWQSAGLRTVGLDGVKAEPYKEGAVGTVYLLSRGGIDLNNAAFVPWMAAVETADTVWLISPSDALTKPLRIELADMTGDGIEELFVSCDLGGQGGDGALGVYVYAVSSDGLSLLFKSEPSQAVQHGFEAETVSFGAIVSHPLTGYRQAVILPSFNGEALQFEASFAQCEPKDIGNDGVYELCAKTYAYLETRANRVGYGVTVWAFDGTQPTLLEAWFEATEDKNDGTLSLEAVQRQLSAQHGNRLMWYYGLGNAMSCEADAKLESLLRISEWEELSEVKRNPETGQVVLRWLYFREGASSYYVSIGNRYAALERYDAVTLAADGQEQQWDVFQGGVYYTLPQEEDGVILGHLAQLCNAYAEEYGLPDYD